MRFLGGKILWRRSGRRRKRRVPYGSNGIVCSQIHIGSANGVLILDKERTLTLRIPVDRALGRHRRRDLHPLARLNELDICHLLTGRIRNPCHDVRLGVHINILAHAKRMAHAHAALGISL